MSNIYQHLIDTCRGAVRLLLPARCPFCSHALTSEQGPFCVSCERALRAAVQAKRPCAVCEELEALPGKNICPRCGGRESPSPVTACLPFHPTGERLVRALKFGNESGIARGLGALLAERYPREEEGFAVCAVPLHPARHRKRGYNQAVLIAREFCRLRRFRLVEPLVRIRNTRPQARLHRQERALNIKDAFQARPPVPGEGRRLLLLDDVVTTGATLWSCVKPLKDAGWDVQGCLAVFYG